MKHIWAIIFTVLLRFTVGEEQEASGADIGTVSRVQEDEEDCHVIVKNIKIWMVDVILLLSCLILIFIIIYTLYYICICLAELDVVYIETIDI